MADDKKNIPEAAPPAEAPAPAVENAAVPERPAPEPALTDAEAVMLEHEGQAALFEMGEAVPDPADAVTHAEVEEPAAPEVPKAEKEQAQSPAPGKDDPAPAHSGKVVDFAAARDEASKEEKKAAKQKPPTEKDKAAKPSRGRPPKEGKAAPDKAKPPKPRDKKDVLTKWLTKVKCSGIVYLARALHNERSKRMNTIQELQKLREELIREIDEKFDWIIDEVKKESVPSRQKESRKPRNYEIIYPLNVGAGIFKGKRPTGVIFADGRRTENPTWKSVAEELLKDCCKDSDQRQALMDLRGKVLGRNRVLLGSETGKMRSPVKIDEALYIETHYDAETLMRILTTRILDMVGYDYSKIRIAVKAE